MTPTAAYGLMMNLAGVNTRNDDGKSPMTLLRDDLPVVRIALGIPVADSGGLQRPLVQSIYQQLHNYPVGASGKAHAQNTKGNKYNITPVRRQFLTNFRAVVALEAEPDITSAIRASLGGTHSSDRFGLPFLGDNSFMPDRIEPIGAARVHWFEEIGPEDTGEDLRPGVTRLTQWIDRADMSRTRSALYAPTTEAVITPPEKAWTEVGPTKDN